MPPKKADRPYVQEETQDITTVLEEIQRSLKSIITKSNAELDNRESLNLAAIILNNITSLINSLGAQYSSSFSDITSILRHSLQGVTAGILNLEVINSQNNNIFEDKAKKRLKKAFEAIHDCMPGFIKSVKNLPRRETEINLEEMCKSYKSLFANIKFIFKHVTKQAVFRLGDNLEWGKLFILLLDVFVTNPGKYCSDQVVVTVEFTEGKVAIKIKYIKKLRDTEKSQSPEETQDTLISNGNGTRALEECGISVTKKKDIKIRKNVITTLHLSIPAVIINPSES